MRESTVADEIAFENLPIEIQELAQRVLGTPKSVFTAEDVAEAYNAGFDDACDSFDTPWRDNSAGMDYVRSLNIK